MATLKKDMPEFRQTMDEPKVPTPRSSSGKGKLS
jgi:hypothetical protein